MTKALEIEVYEVDSNSYQFRYKVIGELCKEQTEILYTEVNIKIIEKQIRNSYNLTEDFILDGTYVIPSLNSIYLITFEKGKLLSKDTTQSSTLCLYISDRIVINNIPLFKDIDKEHKMYEVSEGEYTLEYELYEPSEDDLKEIFSGQGIILIEETIKFFYPKEKDNYIISDGIYQVYSENKLYIVYYENGGPVFEKTEVWVIIPFLSDSLSLIGNTNEYKKKE